MAADCTQARSTSDLLRAATEGDTASVRELYDRYRADGLRKAGTSGPAGADVAAYDRAFVAAMAESAQLGDGGPEAFGNRLNELLGRATVELAPDEAPAATPRATPVVQPAVVRATTDPGRFRLLALVAGGVVIALGGLLVLVLVLAPRSGSPGEPDRRAEGAPTTVQPTEVMPSPAPPSVGSSSAVAQPVAESSTADDRSGHESPTAVFGTTSTTSGDGSNG